MNKKWIVVIPFLIAGCTAQPSISPKIDKKQNTENSSLDYQTSALDEKPLIESSKSLRMNEPYIIIKDYTYQASPLDSKVTARKNAVEQLTVIVNEEVGIYIEHYLDINKTNMNGALRNEVSSKIKTFSNGINKIEPIKESWNGSQYYLKARVSVDPQRNLNLILEAIKSKATQKDIDRLNKVLSEQKAELESTQSKNISLRKKLVVNEIINEAQREELLKSKKQLSAASRKAIELELEKDKADREFEEIKQKMSEALTDKNNIERKACLSEEGMQRGVVHQIIGKPQSSGDSCEYLSYCDDYYGSVIISYKNSIIQKIYSCD